MASAGFIIEVGVVLGATKAMLGNVESGIAAIGSAVDKLKAKQTTLGKTLEKNLGSTSASIKNVNTEYLKLGTTIKNLQQSQLRLQDNAAKDTMLRNARIQMRSDLMDGLAVGALMTIPVKLAIDFESAMADVRKVVDFKTPQGFKKLGDDLLALSTRMPIAAKELASIAASGGQLGVAEKDLLGFTETIAKMSVAFDMLPEDAGDSMAKLANVYNIPIKNIARLGDAINQLSNESPAKARDIVQTLGRVGGVAKQFGLTELQASSLSNAFISLGKAPEVAGTAINGMLTKLGTADKQGNKFKHALAEMGYSAKDLQKAISQDAEGSLVKFLSTLEKIPAQQRMGILVDLFGLQYADDVAVLAGSVKTYTDSINSINKKDADGNPKFEGSMGREFDARNKTTQANIDKFKNSMTLLGVTIGSVVLPQINQLLDAVMPVIISMAAWADKNKELVASAFKVLAFFAGMKLGSLALRYSFNLVSSGINGIFTPFNLLFGKYQLLKSLNMQGVGSLSKFFQVLGFGAGKAEFLGKWLGKLGTFALSAGKFLGGVLLSGLRMAGMKLGSLALSAGKFLGGVLLSGLRMAGQAILFIGRALLMNPIGLLITGIAVAAFLIYKYWAPITAFFGKLWTGIKTKFKAGLAWFIELHVQFYDLGKNLITGLVGGITNKLGAAKNAIVNFGKSIKNWFAETLGIKSPSRVFMTMGNHIGDGASIGMQQRIGAVASSAKKLAGAAIAGAALSANPAYAGGAGQAVAIHFSPTIHISGASGNMSGQVQQAMQLSFIEFEKMMKKYEAGKRRVAF